MRKYYYCKLRDQDCDPDHLTEAQNELYELIRELGDASENGLILIDELEKEPRASSMTVVALAHELLKKELIHFSWELGPTPENCELDRMIEERCPARRDQIMETYRSVGYGAAAALLDEFETWS